MMTMANMEGCISRTHIIQMMKMRKYHGFFLDPDKGCTLSYEDKPFDCKIWPLRIMKKDDEYVIALTPTCPSIGKEPSDELQKLVDDGLGDVIYDYAKTHPFIIKDYKEGFPVLMVRK